MAASGIGADAVVRRLRERAASYDPALAGELGVDLVRRTDGFVASTMQFDLSTGDRHRRVLVKIARETSREPAPGSRPRLAPLCEPRLRPALEHATMSRVHAHFGSLGDPRFGAVRVLDLWSDPPAVVMQVVEGTTLRRELLRRHRPGLEKIVENTGAWLHAYHGFDVEHSLDRATRRQEFVDSVRQLVGYLGKQLGKRTYFEAVGDAVQSVAKRLPDRLPVGVNHGDFAPRNVLVAADARVTVIDTLARWRAPIYEDLGCFLTSMRTLAPQVYTQGRFLDRARLERLSEAFLRGYFGAYPRPLEAIRLYEIQALLGRWASLVHRQGHGRLRARLTRPASRWLINRYFGQLLERTLQELESEPSAPVLRRGKLATPPGSGPPEAH